MTLDQMGLPEGLTEIMQAVFKKAKKTNPGLTEAKFFQGIFEEWLEPYSRDITILPKNEVALKNNIKDAIKLSGKSQAKIAEEIGINRPHLNNVINGKSEPSIKTVLLLLNSLNYPAEKINDLFYLEPVIKE